MLGRLCRTITRAAALSATLTASCGTRRVRECESGENGGEQTMARRSGVTLIEVLVSIFVTAIGLLALLALFPVGAFSMATAIKNGRCVQASINAKALAT